MKQSRIVLKIDEYTVETVVYFRFLGNKITCLAMTQEMHYKPISRIAQDDKHQIDQDKRHYKFSNKNAEHVLQ